MNAVRRYGISTRCVHHDTTSVAVYGDYDVYRDGYHGHPFVITRGYNKYHRPDLRQIVDSMLRVDRRISVAAPLFNGMSTTQQEYLDVLVVSHRVSTDLQVQHRFDPFQESKSRETSE